MVCMLRNNPGKAQVCPGLQVPMLHKTCFRHYQTSFTALTQLSTCDHAHMQAHVPIWSQTSATVGDKDPFV